MSLPSDVSSREMRFSSNSEGWMVLLLEVSVVSKGERILSVVSRSEKKKD